jgi:hypothetical protein
MASAKKVSFSLKEIGPGTDIESYAAQRTHKTQTEVEFTNHLEGLLKGGIDSQEKESHKGLTYGHSILAAIVYEKYDMAIAELDTLLSLKTDYPTFGQRASSYIQHSKSLVKAIKAKRAIGKLPHVSRSKQKELVGALSIHFNELRTCILNIEKIERHARKEDISSTRWFMMSLYWSLFFVFISALVLASFPDVFVALHQYLTHYLQQIFMFVAHWLWPI